MTGQPKNPSEYLVQESYDPPERRRIWRHISRYRSQFNKPLRFARAIREKYSIAFRSERAPLRGSEQTVSAHRVGIRQLRSYFEYDEEYAVEHISDQSWQFFDRVSQLIRQSEFPDLTPEIFDYYTTNVALLGAAGIDQLPRHFILRPAQPDQELRTALLEIYEVADTRHARIRLWENISRTSDPKALYFQFMQGDRSSFIEWNGLVQFRFPTRRPKREDVLFRNHDATMLLKEYDTDQPGSLILYNVARDQDDHSGLGRFRTPYSETSYVFDEQFSDD